MRRAIQFLLLYLGVSLLLALVWAITAFPHFPSTPAQGLWILVLALPVQLAGEFLGERLWNNRIARRVERSGAGAGFSWLRVGYGLMALLLVCGALLGAAQLWQMAGL
jgi:hypothetical protein